MNAYGERWKAYALGVHEYVTLQAEAPSFADKAAEGARSRSQASRELGEVLRRAYWLGVARASRA